MRAWVVLGVAGALCAGGAPGPAARGSVVRPAAAASFMLRYKGLEAGHHVGVVFVLPGHPLSIEVVQPGAGRFVLRATQGTVAPLGPAAWRWHAPATPGLYPLWVVHETAQDSITLNAFVLVPSGAQRGEYLNGYRIGRYPARPLRGLAAYEAPLGFVEVTAANRDVPVSPHFRLGEFVAKQAGDYPKYVVLDERLLLKLEYLLERVRAAGFPAARFHVMSGYRTPYYNRAIGNVGYSRHVYGAAADIFIDQSPHDGVMDDLNGDGRVDVADARMLRGVIEAQVGMRAYEPFVGGLAAYRGTKVHGPFVHVDVRGYRARW